VSRADFETQQSPTQTAATSFTTRLLRYLLPSGAPERGN
jgi:hypothetical protein